MIGLGVLLLSYAWLRQPSEPAEQRHRKKSYDQPGEAQAFYALQRVPPGAEAIPVERYAAARRHMAGMRQYSTQLGQFLGKASRSPALLWSWLGPGNVGGRTRALVIDPDTPTTMYAAGVAGGIWKTTDGGASWTPLSDMIANLAVVSLALVPGNPSVLYAGTGEGVFNFDAVRGDGIFKTTDGGASWVQLGSTAGNSSFHYVADIVVSPNNTQHVYAATRTGVWRSQNGGTTWTPVLSPNGSNSRCLDLAIRSDRNPDHVFASCGTFSNVPGRIHRSTDGGNTWTEVLAEPGMGRTTLAIAPSNQDVLYALAASTQAGDYEDGLHKVFRSTDGGATWTARVANTSPTLLNTLLLSNPMVRLCSGIVLSQGWYDNALAVDPLNENIVWAGGIDLFRSNDGGASWGIASWWAATPGQPRYVHADQHIIVFHPDYNGTTNKQMFVGTDGGIFRTGNPDGALGTGSSCSISSGIGVSWTSLNNGYGVTQFYHGAVYPNGLTFFGGTQDNGTIRDTDDANPNNWAEILDGDGGYVAISPANTNVLFAEYAGLSIRKSTNGGASFSSAIQGISEASTNFLFITPFIMNPSNAQQLWTGGHYLWRTTNQAASWTRASALLKGADSDPEGSVSALAVAPTDANYVLAGLSNGYILRSQAATTATSTTAWAFSCPATGAGRPRFGFVSSLTFDPLDKNVAYATYSTFGGDHILKSTDAGACWTAIDRRGQADGIPDIPVHTLVVDPTDTRRLFVGTDLGVFVTTDGGATWAVENGGFANVVVESLSLREDGANLELFAFTHGRGVFKATTATGAPAVYTNLRVFLQGAYAGGQTMRADLNSGGHLAAHATGQPYQAPPWQYPGGEAVAAGFFSSNPQVVDWVLVELRTGNPAAPPMNVVARRAALLRADGTLVDTDGISKIRFEGVGVNQAYVVLRHRNHLAIMSPTLITLDAGGGPAGAPYQHDFTTAQAQAYTTGPDPMNALGDGRYGLIAGDVNADGTVNYFNIISGDDRTVVLAALGGDPTASTTGYALPDATMNGTVNYFNIISGDDRTVILAALGGDATRAKQSAVPSP